MKVHTIQTTTNILDENNKIIKTTTVETYTLIPEIGKVLKHVPTNRIFTQSVNIGSRGKIKDYIEVEL